MLPSPRSRHLLALVLAVALVPAGCARVLETPPGPTPGDFPALASALAARGVAVDRIASGDAGCADPDLAPTAVRFTASGLDQPEAVVARTYIFGSQAAYDRRRRSVDTCAAAYISNPDQLQVVDAAPFVLVGEGPWGPRFSAAVASALREVAARP